jgi:hypothetical protein
MNLLNIDTTIYIEYFIKPGLPSDGNFGSISTFEISRDKNWFNDNESKIVNFYNELQKWSAIGSLKTHKVRINEKNWSLNFNSDC